MNKTILAWTDGSAEVTSPDKLGGIGVYMFYNGVEKTISRGFRNTKTGRCELRAIIECLRSIKDKSFNVIIHSDSQYAVNTCSEWVFNWEKQLFAGKANEDLLVQYLEEYREFKGKIQFVWVKGHTDNQGNIYADCLASYKNFTEYEVDQKEVTDVRDFQGVNKEYKQLKS